MTASASALDQVSLGKYHRKEEAGGRRRIVRQSIADVVKSEKVSENPNRTSALKRLHEETWNKARAAAARRSTSKDVIRLVGEEKLAPFVEGSQSVACPIRTVRWKTPAGPTVTLLVVSESHGGGLLYGYLSSQADEDLCVAAGVPPSRRGFSDQWQVALSGDIVEEIDKIC